MSPAKIADDSEVEKTGEKTLPNRTPHREKEEFNLLPSFAELPSHKHSNPSFPSHAGQSVLDEMISVQYRQMEKTLAQSESTYDSLSISGTPLLTTELQPVKDWVNEAGKKVRPFDKVYK